MNYIKNIIKAFQPIPYNERDDITAKYRYSLKNRFISIWYGNLGLPTKEQAVFFIEGFSNGKSKR